MERYYGKKINRIYNPRKYEHFVKYFQNYYEYMYQTVARPHFTIKIGQYVTYRRGQFETQNVRDYAMIEFKRNTDDGKKAFSQSTPLPPGRYAVTVEKVIVAVKEFAKKNKNPTGEVLNVHLATTIDGKKRFVFDDIATNDTRRIDELTAAVGLPALEDVESFNEQTLVGRDLQVLVGVWTSKKDSTKKGNEVTDYLPRMNT